MSQIFKDKSLLTLSLLAIAAFVPLFIFRQAGPLDFWWWMSANLIILISLGLASDKLYRRTLFQQGHLEPLKAIAGGVFAALILFIIFWAGNHLSRFLFDFASENIVSIYDFKGDAAEIRIFLLMMLIIGPGEEIFWRGYIQMKLEQPLGKTRAFIFASIFYTAVHIFSGNPILVLAALVCGLFWGWLYMKYQSILLNIISHTVWDITVFLLLPFS